MAFQAILRASLKLEALERFRIECAILNNLDLSIILLRLREKLICLYLTFNGLQVIFNTTKLAKNYQICKLNTLIF